MNIEIEDLNSWPLEFRQKAINSKPLIISYHRERLCRDQRCEEKVLLRINPPENKYERPYLELVKNLETLLIPHRIIAYHCSRLTKEEITNIKQGGLQVLSTELIHRRLRECLSDGYLKESEHKSLMTSQSVSESLDDKYGARIGKICFCANRSTLQDSHAVYRLFRSWGGEAVYRSHEENSDIGHILRRVGMPCIVVCAIPFIRAKKYCPYFSEYFLSYFMTDEFEYPEPNSEFNISVEMNLNASEVLDVIDYSNPRFEDLTCHSSWPTNIKSY